MQQDFLPINLPESDIVIRKFYLEDVQSLAYHANNYKIYEMLSSLFPYPYRFDDAVSWIEFTNRLSDNLHLAIAIKGKVVGGIGLRKNALITDSYELGYWLGEEFWGSGMMTNIVKEFLLYITKQKAYSKIVAYVLPYNLASMRVLEKSGFQKNEYGRQKVQKDGKELTLNLYLLNSISC